MLELASALNIVYQKLLLLVVMASLWGSASSRTEDLVATDDPSLTCQLMMLGPVATGQEPRAAWWLGARRASSPGLKRWWSLMRKVRNPKSSQLRSVPLARMPPCFERTVSDYLYKPVSEDSDIAFKASRRYSNLKPLCRVILVSVLPVRHNSVCMKSSTSPRPHSRLCRFCSDIALSFQLSRASHISV